MMQSLLLGAALAVGQVSPATPPVAAPPVSPSNGTATCTECAGGQGSNCFQRFFQAYHDEFYPPPSNGNNEPKEEPARRAFPAPFAAPFPATEWQGSPLIGVPPDSSEYPLMKALKGTSLGDLMKENRINAYGWANGSANLSTSKNSNSPSSYWLVPNSVQLDQLIFRVERQLDSVQTEHVDWGFRSTVLYGTDYRYMVAGGWWPGDNQLLVNNQLYGVDFTEQYVECYVPNVAQGLILRLGRWIACPDIETQFAPDNYLATHSILFTFDTYTQTGLLATLMLNKQLSVQLGVNCGNDMAPWYQGATVSGMLGIRWVSADNNDSIYAVLNQINDAQFRYFQLNGQPAGHDNFNYPVVTWQHKFNDCLITKQEAYFMWQNNAVIGGTPSIGPTQSFGGGGGIGATIPGTALAYGTVNYTMLKTSDKSFVTVRNEWWKDEDGMRSGYAGNYTSNTVGITYNFNSVLQVRPEIGYYRNWNQGAFDLGTRKDMLMGGLDVTMRF